MSRVSLDHVIPIPAVRPVQPVRSKEAEDAHLLLDAAHLEEVLRQSHLEERRAAFARARNRRVTQPREVSGAELLRRLEDVVLEGELAGEAAREK